MNDDLSVLVESLRSDDPVQRHAAAAQLAHLGHDARPVAVALVQACEMDDEDARELVVAALEYLGPPLPDDVGQLAALLERPALDTAYWAATLLGRLEAPAAPSVQALANALTAHPELAVRQRAAWALGKVGPAAGAARQALQQAAAGANPRLASLAVEALHRLST